MEKVEDKKTCFICRTKLSPSEIFKLRNGLEEKTVKWGERCAETVCEIFFGDPSHPLKIYFQNGAYCSKCQTMIWDLDFCWRQLLLIRNQVDSLSLSLRKLLMANFRAVRDKVNIAVPDFDQVHFYGKYSYDQVIQFLRKLLKNGDALSGVNVPFGRTPDCTEGNLRAQERNIQEKLSSDNRKTNDNKIQKRNLRSNINNRNISVAPEIAPTVPLQPVKGVVILNNNRRKRKRRKILLVKIPKRNKNDNHRDSDSGTHFMQNESSFNDSQNNSNENNASTVNENTVTTRKRSLRKTADLANLENQEKSGAPVKKDNNISSSSSIQIPARRSSDDTTKNVEQSPSPTKSPYPLRGRPINTKGTKRTSDHEEAIENDDNPLGDPVSPSSMKQEIGSPPSMLEFDVCSNGGSFRDDSSDVEVVGQTEVFLVNTNDKSNDQTVSPPRNSRQKRVATEPNMRVVKKRARRAVSVKPAADQLENQNESGQNAILNIIRGSRRRLAPNKALIQKTLDSYLKKTDLQSKTNASSKQSPTLPNRKQNQTTALSNSPETHQGIINITNPNSGFILVEDPSKKSSSSLSREHTVNLQAINEPIKLVEPVFNSNDEDISILQRSASVPNTDKLTKDKSQREAPVRRSSRKVLKLPSSGSDSSDSQDDRTFSVRTPDKLPDTLPKQDKQMPKSNIGNKGILKPTSIKKRVRIVLPGESSGDEEVAPGATSYPDERAPIRRKVNTNIPNYSPTKWVSPNIRLALPNDSSSDSDEDVLPVKSTLQNKIHPRHNEGNCKPEGSRSRKPLLTDTSIKSPSVRHHDPRPSLSVKATRKSAPTLAKQSSNARSPHTERSSSINNSRVLDLPSDSSSEDEEDTAHVEINPSERDSILIKYERKSVHTERPPSINNSRSRVMDLPSDSSSDDEEDTVQVGTNPSERNSSLVKYEDKLNTVNFSPTRRIFPNVRLGMPSDSSDADEEIPPANTALPNKSDSNKTVLNSRSLKTTLASSRKKVRSPAPVHSDVTEIKRGPNVSRRVMAAKMNNTSVVKLAVLGRNFKSVARKVIAKPASSNKMGETVSSSDWSSSSSDEDVAPVITRVLGSTSITQEKILNYSPIKPVSPNLNLIMPSDSSSSDEDIQPTKGVSLSKVKRSVQNPVNAIQNIVTIPDKRTNNNSMKSQNSSKVSMSTSVISEKTFSNFTSTPEKSKGIYTDDTEKDSDVVMLSESSCDEELTAIENDMQVSFAEDELAITSEAKTLQGSQSSGNQHEHDMEPTKKSNMAKANVVKRVEKIVSPNKKVEIIMPNDSSSSDEDIQPTKGVSLSKVKPSVQNPLNVIQNIVTIPDKRTNNNSLKIQNSSKVPMSSSVISEKSFSNFTSTPEKSKGMYTDYIEEDSDVVMLSERSCDEELSSIESDMQDSFADDEVVITSEAKTLQGSQSSSSQHEDDIETTKSNVAKATVVKRVEKFVSPNKNVELVIPNDSSSEDENFPMSIDLPSNVDKNPLCISVDLSNHLGGRQSTANSDTERSDQCDANNLVVHGTDNSMTDLSKEPFVHNYSQRKSIEFVISDNSSSGDEIMPVDHVAVGTLEDARERKTTKDDQPPGDNGSEKFDEGNNLIAGHTHTLLTALSKEAASNSTKSTEEIASPQKGVVVDGTIQVVRSNKDMLHGESSIMPISLVEKPLKGIGRSKTVKNIQKEDENISISLEKASRHKCLEIGIPAISRVNSDSQETSVVETNLPVLALHQVDDQNVSMATSSKDDKVKTSAEKYVSPKKPPSSRDKNEYILPFTLTCENNSSEGDTQLNITTDLKQTRESCPIRAEMAKDDNVKIDTKLPGHTSNIGAVFIEKYGPATPKTIPQISKMMSPTKSNLLALPSDSSSDEIDEDIELSKSTSVKKDMLCVYPIKSLESCKETLMALGGGQINTSDSEDDATSNVVEYIPSRNKSYIPVNTRRVPSKYPAKQTEKVPSPVKAKTIKSVELVMPSVSSGDSGDEDDEATQKGTDVTAMPEKSSSAKIADAAVKRTPSGRNTCIFKSCGKSFDNEQDMFLHFRIGHLHDKRPYHCDHPGCKKKFVNSILLGKHAISHITPVRFKCKECRKGFKTVDELQIHRDKKHGSGKQFYTCIMCFDTFSSIAEMNLHNATAHTDTPDKKLKCGLCEIEFPTNQALLIHKKIHADIPRSKLCKCHCGLTFVDRESYDNHAKTHSKGMERSGKEEWKCKICGDSFVWKLRLKSHLKRHTDGKMLYCRICGKSHDKKSELQEHESAHANSTLTNKFCKVCGFEVDNDSALEKHLSLVHTNDSGSSENE